MLLLDEPLVALDDWELLLWDWPFQLWLKSCHGTGIIFPVMP